MLTLWCYAILCLTMRVSDTNSILLCIIVFMVLAVRPLYRYCTRRYVPGQLGASLFRVHQQKGSWRNGRQAQAGRYSTQTSPFNRDRIDEPPPPPPPPTKPVPDRSVQVAVSIHVHRSGYLGVTQVQHLSPGSYLSI